jgi:hypothetical protein
MMAWRRTRHLQGMVLQHGVCVRWAASWTGDPTHPGSACDGTCVSVLGSLTLREGLQCMQMCGCAPMALTSFGAPRRPTGLRRRLLQQNAVCVWWFLFHGVLATARGHWQAARTVLSGCEAWQQCARGRVLGGGSRRRPSYSTQVMSQSFGWRARPCGLSADALCGDISTRGCRSMAGATQDVGALFLAGSACARVVVIRTQHCWVLRARGVPSAHDNTCKGGVRTATSSMHAHRCGSCSHSLMLAWVGVSALVHADRRWVGTLGVGWQVVEVLHSLAPTPADGARRSCMLCDCIRSCHGLPAFCLALLAVRAVACRHAACCARAVARTHPLPD